MRTKLAGAKLSSKLMFGVNCGPESFQCMMETKLQGINGVILFIDDVLIFAHDLTELQTRTAQVIEALKRNNLTINMAKSEFGKFEIKFLGHRLSFKGFNIDKNKIRAFKAFTRPRNVTDLRSFLDLAAYLSDYVPSFVDLAAPTWERVRATPFAWTKSAEQAFEATKTAIAEATTTIGFFDVTWQTVLYTDASPYALGAVLVQEREGKKNRTICFASKTLTETEKKYPQVRREALAIVWAVERHFYYLLGRRLKLRTDARGLAFIYNRSRETCK
jgi:hypothetical protein